MNYVKKHKFLIIFLLVLVLGAVFWWRSSQESATVSIEETAVLKIGSVRKVLSATGIVKSQVGAVVKTGTRATGVIEQMLVRVGDQVGDGQLIAKIDSREQEADLAQAEARLGAARAELAFAILLEKRMSGLSGRDLTSRESYDDAKRRADAARSVVAEAEAGLSGAKIRLSYTSIFSPLSGVVSEVTAQEGETVVAGLQVANLITVLDPTQLEMWIYVDETDLGQVTPGLMVEFYVDAYPDDIFPGIVDQIYPQPEIRDNIVYYRALVKLGPESAAKLRPEMTTQCRIIVESKDNILVIPNNAVKWVDNEQVVYVQTPGGHRVVHPQLGLVGPDVSEVLSGLKEGDKVATRLNIRTASGS
jgi:RND family efflux transporter MFP subunit